MSQTRPSRRFVVSDLGFGFAVHDTRVPQSYGHPAGRESEHPSRNTLNSRILDVFPTRGQAQARADELERAAQSRVSSPDSA